MNETMCRLYISYRKDNKHPNKTLSISLLFPNEFAVRMWAEQWAWRYFNRPGEWCEIMNMYELEWEWPQEYIAGLSIGYHHVEVHDYKQHKVTDERFMPDYQIPENQQKQKRPSQEEMLSKDELFYSGENHDQSPNSQVD